MNTFVLSIGIRIYSTAMELAAVCIVPVLSPIGRRRGWNLAERTMIPRIVHNNRSRSLVWVHAASLGEAKLLYQFLSVLERRNPGDGYVVTATTRAGVEYIERMTRPSVYAVGFLPFDSLKRMSAILDTFSISRVWLIETELWPAMLSACFRKNIPVGIANGRMEERSFTRYKKWSFLLSPLLRELDIVLVQSEPYARRFQRLGVKPERLHIVGNLKSLMPIRPPQASERAVARLALRLRPEDIVITAGCVHAGEGVTIRTAIDELNKKGYGCKLIVVPRYLTEADAIAAELGSDCHRFRDTSAHTSWGCCLIEKLGILEEMYLIADAAIVGGTFVDIGGHNMWEPARIGIPVFFGPYYHEQRSTCEKLLAAGVGFEASSAHDLSAGLEKTLWKGRKSFDAARDSFAENTNNQQIVLEPLLP